MKNTLSVLITLIAALGLSAAAYSGDDDDSDGGALRFEASLSGAQEVPGVFTDTTGKLRLNFDRGLSEADFRLRVNDGIDVTQAHFHCARAGANGPVVVFLFGFIAGGVDVDGRLSKGTLTNADFLGADCTGTTGRPINNIASLAFAARDGLIYVNVHTVANPAGEVRGQLLER